MALIVAFAFTQSALASDRTFKLGLRVADAVVVTYGDDVEDENDLSGNSYFIDVPMEIAFNPIISLVIDPGLEISVLTSSMESTDLELDLLYLDLPILARFNFGGGFAMVGPQMNINMVATLDNGYSTDDYDYMNSPEFGLTVGGGYRFWFGLEIDARFNMGLSDMFDTDYGSIDVKRMGFQFGLSYWFLH